MSTSQWSQSVSWALTTKDIDCPPAWPAELFTSQYWTDWELSECSGSAGAAAGCGCGCSWAWQTSSRALYCQVTRGGLVWWWYHIPLLLLSIWQVCSVSLRSTQPLQPPSLTATAHSLSLSLSLARAEAEDGRGCPGRCGPWCNTTAQGGPTTSVSPVSPHSPSASPLSSPLSLSSYCPPPPPHNNINYMINICHCSLDREDHQPTLL